MNSVLLYNCELARGLILSPYPHLTDAGRRQIVDAYCLLSEASFFIYYRFQQFFDLCFL